MSKPLCIILGLNRGTLRTRLYGSGKNGDGAPELTSLRMRRAGVGFPPHTTLDMSSQTEVDQINAAAGSQVAEFVCAEPDGDALDPSLQNIIDQRQPVLAVLAPCRY